MTSVKTIASLTAALLMGLSSVALAQTPPAAAPAPSAPAAAAKPAAPAAAPAPAAKAATPAAPGSAPATAVVPAAKQVDPAMAKFWATCKADVEKYCADAAAQRKAVGKAAGAEKTTGDTAVKGKGRSQVVACLNTNVANLTPDCKTSFEERKAAAKAKKS
jgi:hypothetical protein